MRFDGGYESGDTISQYYDNLVGKLIVWGQDRDAVIARTIRALDEMVVEGIHTTIPADLAILRHPDFKAVKHSTKWVEETLDLSGIVSTTGGTQADDDGLVERSTTVEVNGKRFDVKMWVPEFVAGAPRKAKKTLRGGGSTGSAMGSGDVVAPMQGTIVKVIATVGQTVAVGDAVVVLEAMKMENQITTEKAGTVTKINVTAGVTVGAGDILVVIE